MSIIIAIVAITTINVNEGCWLQADAQVLGLLLLIQDILVHKGRDPSHPCHIVSTVRRPQTIEVWHLPMMRGEVCIAYCMSDLL